MQSILIVDDLESIHEMLEAVIQPIGYNTVFATDGEIALEKLRHEKYDIVLTDINMKPMDGITLLKEIKSIDPDAVVLMMSGFANVDNATQALKFGAFDFLTKPFKVDQLMASIARASDERKKRLEAKSGTEGARASLFSGDSPSIKKLNQSIERHGNSKTPLLITGEVGTQKIAIAAAIHQIGSNGELLSLDARKLDDQEFYDDLFDANGNPSPKLENAKGGSLFIANIDNLSLKNQDRLGNLIRDLKGEIRVMASSNRDLEKLVEKGEFENALFFRIATSTIEVPSLRNRNEDIPAIAMSLLGKYGMSHLRLDEQASKLLQAYQWPGNYSELDQTLETAAELAGPDNIIYKENLPQKLADTSGWPSLEEFLDDQANRYKSSVLRACGGDRSKAANVLGCDPSELN